MREEDTEREAGVGVTYIYGWPAWGPCGLWMRALSCARAGVEGAGNRAESS